jgi:hypothetical protein
MGGPGWPGLLHRGPMRGPLFGVLRQRAPRPTSSPSQLLPHLAPLEKRPLIPPFPHPPPTSSLPRFFETFSYLPPLTTDQISRQVDYIVRNGWTPCLEFADAATAYVSNENVIRIQNGATCVSGTFGP